MGAGSIGFTIKMFLIDGMNAVTPGDADVSVIGIISTLTTAFLAALLKFQKGADKISETQGEQLNLLKEMTKRDEEQLGLLKDMAKNDEQMLETQIDMLDSQKAHIKAQNELMQMYLEGQRIEEPKKRKSFLAEKIKEILD